MRAQPVFSQLLTRGLAAIRQKTVRVEKCVYSMRVWTSWSFAQGDNVLASSSASTRVEIFRWGLVFGCSGILVVVQCYHIATVRYYGRLPVDKASNIYAQLVMWYG